MYCELQSSQYIDTEYVQDRGPRPIGLNILCHMRRDTHTLKYHKSKTRIYKHTILS